MPKGLLTGNPQEIDLGSHKLLCFTLCSLNPLFYLSSTT